MNKSDLLQAAINFTNEKGFIPETNELAAYLDIEHEDILQVYSDTDELVKDFFREAIAVISEQNNEIEAYESLSFGEGFAHWIYSLADVLKSEPVFSKIGLNVIESGIFFSSAIESELKSIFYELIQHDTNISASAHLLIGDIFFGQLIRDVEHFLKLDLNEELESDQWTERIDKYASFLDSALHNTLPDKGFDYLKTLYSQGEFSLKKWLF
ncbi:hypothetical protein EP331_01060 [bacterium]|nr:MAG: hypothetical protein EP331_01060 [bacterium]